jgi:hypothetical protein
MRGEYAVSMEELTSVGGLVTVADGGPPLDGIVFDVPSRTKVVVAVLDPSRGPVFRTVHPRTLTDREQETPGDRPLRMLIKRTPPPAHGRSAEGAATGRGSRGHSRGTMHRTTGK